MSFACIVALSVANSRHLPFLFSLVEGCVVIDCRGLAVFLEILYMMVIKHSFGVSDLICIASTQRRNPMMAFFFFLIYMFGAWGNLWSWCKSLLNLLWIKPPRKRILSALWVPTLVSPSLVRQKAMFLQYYHSLICYGLPGNVHIFS